MGRRLILIYNDKDLKKLKDELRSLEKHLNIAKNLMRFLEDKAKKSFEDIPGIVGTFDGEYMVTDSGEKFVVSPNYAAKSLLLFGDKLKMIDENGKPFFKNISKSNPKEIHGILSKKEDEWYILADCGSYKISEIAATFHNVQQNMEATAVIPADNIKAPYAALKKVVGEDKGKPKEPSKPVLKPKEVKPKPKLPKKEAPKKEAVTPPAKKELPKADTPTAIPLDEDDLR